MPVRFSSGFAQLEWPHLCGFVLPWPLWILSGNPCHTLVDYRSLPAYGFRLSCFCLPWGGAPCLRLLLLCQLVSGAMATPMFPKTSGETAKARLRAARGPLPEGRPVLPSTGSARQRYLLAFDEWTGEQKIDFRSLLDNHHVCIDQINEILSTYGRALYNSGKSYNQYAETLNGITSIKPAIRRMLQGAWDVGYSWIRAEPSSHHTALPPQILLVMISVSLVWGWVAFAGCLALGFGALLRPGEIFAATRKHLFLPEDAIGFIDYALISIDEPKSRFTNARRQTAKLDARDLLEVVVFCFGPLQAHQKLWPFSGQTFRERFKSVLYGLFVFPRRPSSISNRWILAVFAQAEPLF